MIGPSRQRMLDAFQYTAPDQIPVVYHPSPAGLHVHGEKLLELFRRHPPDNPITFESVPHPAPETVDAHGNYHELRKDAWGTVWEFRIFGIQGHPCEYPFPDWDAAARYEFPPIPTSAALQAEKHRIEELKKEYLVFRGGVSIFERLHALRPMDEALIDLHAGTPALYRFLERLMAYWLRMIDVWLTLDVDVVTFGDDWGTQTAPLISPALFRRVFRPRYEVLFEPIKRTGKRVFFHSCGRLGPILDDLLELGVDGFWPQLACYDERELARACREHGVAMYIHPDRQRLVPLGTPAEIDARIRQYAERYRAMGGGGIFYVEMENDAPWENVRTLIESIHRYR
ncbi:MAG: hypothetical protein GXP31_19495 [Kiritimatiellaeota bacterium]|nr:hypothetical protein [Kiritimatiellota bacterium]